MDPQSLWLDKLRSFQTVHELKQSEFFAGCGKQIEAYLRTPHHYPGVQVKPILRSFIRVAQWNIEKGKRFNSILRLLQDNEILRWADVLILNEADLGMVRSDNRNVARDLADALGMHAVFGPAHFELTRGVDEELLLEGSNRESLQGNAILSRYPIIESTVVPLPVTFEPYEFHEKRFGSRSCLWARLEAGSTRFWIGAVHLELRNTPHCRARQMRHILRNLPYAQADAAILGGDLNTNSFGRGTGWRMTKSVLRLLFRSPDKLRGELLHPESGNEPLFNAVEKETFDWKAFNSNEETARTAIDSLEESAHLPGPVLRLVTRRLEPYQGCLSFKLDWLLGRNIRALSGGQMRDVQTGVLSLDPGVVKAKNYGPHRMSDHLPIYADIDLS